MSLSRVNLSEATLPPSLPVKTVSPSSDSRAFREYSTKETRSATACGSSTTSISPGWESAGFRAESASSTTSSTILRTGMALQAFDTVDL